MSEQEYRTTDRTGDSSLDAAVLSSLDDLLAALDLEPLGDDHYRATSEPERFPAVFGGQLVAQALLAAGASAADRPPHSMHAYFVEAGIPGEAVELRVERLRDGRSMCTRQVTVHQGERTLLRALVSFHTNDPVAELGDTAPTATAPERIPLLQKWAQGASPELSGHAARWIEQPPPLEMRIGEPPSFLGGGPRSDARTHWMRLPRDVGDDPLLHATLLAYASDYFLLDMVPRAKVDAGAPGAYTGVSIDHALWFHQQPRLDRWHQHRQLTRAISGHRGLVEGVIHDAFGQLVATAMQEVLIRPRPR